MMIVIIKQTFEIMLYIHKSIDILFMMMMCYTTTTQTIITKNQYCILVRHSAGFTPSYLLSTIS
jgi:hypothetical protein